jgi:signal transduction histidine kinase
MRFIATVMIVLNALFACSAGCVAEPATRSVLLLDQSSHFSPWPTSIIAAIRSTINDGRADPVTVYVEHLDLFRFKGQAFASSLENHFRDKYRDKSIGVIVVIGPTALDFTLNLRAAVWPSIPIVFAAVEEAHFATTQGIPPNVTGVTMRHTLASMIDAARIVVPDLKGFAIVGTRLEEKTYHYNFAAELPNFSRDLQFIDLMGLSVDETRHRVSELPERTAILYIGINFYGSTNYVAAEVAPLIAERANRPIIIDAESFFGSGAVGGFLLTSQQIGQDAGRLALRVLEGEDISGIPIATGGPLKPTFDWRQLQRWQVDESRLPSGSEIRFRVPTAWERYHTQILSVFVALLVQAALICWLFYEHRRRHVAEISSRNFMSELTHMNRVATAGELSASIAHEVNQPLTGIVTRASAGRRWLTGERPDIDKARAAFDQIEVAGHRAAEIIKNLRSMFRKDTTDKSAIDINKLIWNVLGLVYIDLRKHQIDLQSELADQLPPVLGNQVQLQQVILNLIMNAIDSMRSVEPRVLSVKSKLNPRHVVQVSIEDTGIGIDPANLHQIFNALFTTKQNGMGMGLSICRSIIESHDGRIWVSSGVNGGSIFQFELPIKSKKDNVDTMAAYGPGSR